jgi:hypothetical protein
MVRAVSAIQHPIPTKLTANAAHALKRTATAA